MAITTTLQPKYTVRMIAIAIVSLVLGLWGVYDYVARIPTKARAYERGQVYRLVKRALETGATGQTLDEADAAVQAKLDDVVARNVAPEGEGELDPEQFAETLDANDDRQWLGELVLFKAALLEAGRRRGDQPASAQFVQANQLATQRVNETAEISPPGKFDRATQWMFILCLPVVPYVIWVLVQARSRVYRLEDDGSFHSPDGTWPKADIADVDMSRWMSKSVAFVVHRDGQRVKLDDYLYRDTHRIVGVMAAERYPDRWDAEAKPKKEPEPPAPVPDPEEPAEPAETAAVEAGPEA